MTKLNKYKGNRYYLRVSHHDNTESYHIIDAVTDKIIETVKYKKYKNQALDRLYQLNYGEDIGKSVFDEEVNRNENS